MQDCLASPQHVSREQTHQGGLNKISLLSDETQHAGFFVWLAGYTRTAREHSTRDPDALQVFNQYANWVLDHISDATTLNSMVHLHPHDYVSWQGPCPLVDPFSISGGKP